MLTRRTSGATVRLGGLLSTEGCGGGERFVDAAIAIGGTVGWTNSLSRRDWETLTGGFRETPDDCTSCDLGNFHFPSASCGQPTRGLISETSLITSLWEQRERNRTRSRNVVASRKCLE